MNLSVNDLFQNLGGKTKQSYRMKAHGGADGVAVFFKATSRDSLQGFEKMRDDREPLMTCMYGSVIDSARCIIVFNLTEHCLYVESA